MQKMELIPNISVGFLKLGDKIRKYSHIPHILTKRREGTEEQWYNGNDFYEVGVEVWVKNKIIDTIRCTKQCYWQGHNLIKMPYDEFLARYNVIHDKSDVFYVPINRYRGQNQTVYDFEDLGLMLWVWRGKIKTILISNYSMYDDEE